MKKLLIALLSFYFIIHPHAFAQEMSSESAGLMQVETINYVLPYPGILPDNPLYPLKAFRDRMVSMLIADPVKKSLFNLLQADKRLQSAVYLLYNNDMKHVQLAESTISKGLNYFDEAVSQIGSVQDRGRDVATEIRELTVAAQKHEEVLTQLQSQVPESEKDSFATSIQRVKNLQKRLAVLEKNK